ncbi:MAG: YidC/Oxa1 family membrane protein insertase [Acidimicrobiales bacterium]
MTAVVLFGSTLGKIFSPLTSAMAWLIAFFYALVPNYVFAIALLTIVVMIVTSPLTVKSTKSMVLMQRLAPELKKIQAKYKNDKAKLNEEMMNLYKEHGVNPAGGCLPLIIQMPVFFLLYGVIRGLTHTVTSKTTHVVHAAPLYISHSTKLYQNLVANKGKMPSFGIDLAARVFGHTHFTQAIPYIVLVLVAIGLQYLQMRQLNNRNPAAAQANPQAQMMQRYMPLIFAVIYINISAGVNVYFIVSTLCRIGIQEAIFRSGVIDRAPVKETRLGAAAGGAPKRKTIMERLADAQRQAIEAQQARQAALQAGDTPPRGKPADGSGSGGGKPGTPGNTGRATPNAANGSSRSRQSPSNGSAGNGAGAAKSHPRSKTKRTRKAR